MRTAVCDDDKIFASDFCSLLKKIFSEINISAEIDLYFSGEEAVKSDKEYDMVFLDMEMPGKNGIETAEDLKEINKNTVVFFITSYEKYLDDAMDINAFRFIKKPVDYKRLKSSIEKALNLIDLRIINFSLKNSREKVNVAVSDIVYVGISGRSTEVQLENEIYVSSENMEFWKEKLTAPFFYQVHKSFIVNMKYITLYRRDIIRLCGKYDIPVAYRRQTDFRSRFLSFVGGR